MSEFGYEVDFLPVGNGERSGDAIALRFGKSGEYKTLVYDGGTKESGQALVDHIKTHYGTDRVDYVVSSHPDADHASGLSVIFEQMQVGELWMHRPWLYASTILDYFKDGRITDESLAARLQEKMAAAYDLEKLATEKKVPVFEPFQGSLIGPFTVMSPEKDWYIHELIAEFQKSPEQKKSAGLLATAAEAIRKAVEWIDEHWLFETLREDVSTSAENESSVILYAQIDGRGVMLNGDAGIKALTAAADYADANGVSLSETLRFVQVPHHGSRNNVSTSALDRILGPRKAGKDDVTTKTAFVSSSKESSTHPRKSVVNAFIRRGVKVFATQGSAKQHHHNMPQRGWGSATPLEFSAKVEAWN